MLYGKTRKNNIRWVIINTIYLNRLWREKPNEKGELKEIHFYGYEIFINGESLNYEKLIPVAENRAL